MHTRTHRSWLRSGLKCCCQGGSHRAVVNSSCRPSRKRCTFRQPQIAGKHTLWFKRDRIWRLENGAAGVAWEADDESDGDDKDDERMQPQERSSSQVSEAWPSTSNSTPERKVIQALKSQHVNQLSLSPYFALYIPERASDLISRKLGTENKAFVQAEGRLHPEEVLP